MPENHIPAAQPEAGSSAGEFNFADSGTESLRIKKRNLKAKTPGLIKPNPAALPAARELEREAPPVSAEKAAKPASVKTEEVIAKETVKPAVKSVEAPAAPPRTMPITSVTATTTSATPKIASTATPAVSPHGTRPATLYYTSPTRKAETAAKIETAKAETAKVGSAKPEPSKAEPAKSEPVKAETPTPMKTIPSSGASSSSSGAAQRVATTATAPSSRPSVNVDYRANVERQSREQKSVGSLLSYVVYGLIAFFVISAGLAIYGADVIFKQLHDQSTTVSQLDDRYTKLTNDLSTKLSATQDQLTAAQSQITRQQDVILHQQEQLNQLLASSTTNDAAIKAEKAARAQETAAIRVRLKEVEYKTSVQKY